MLTHHRPTTRGRHHPDHVATPKLPRDRGRAHVRLPRTLPDCRPTQLGARDGGVAPCGAAIAQPIRLGGPSKTVRRTWRRSRWRGPPRAGAGSARAARALDRSSAVQDDLSAGRVVEPLGEVTERKGQALQTDEILDDEAGLRDLLPQLLRPVAVAGEPAGNAVVEPPALLDDTDELCEESRA